MRSFSAYPFQVLLVVVALMIIPSQAWPHAEVNSREYKALLKPSLFQGEQSQIDSALESLQQDLTQAAKRVGTNVRGSWAIKSGTPRHVRYYDTPGKCWLRHHDFVLRTRRSIENSKEDWEGTLKSKSGDRYHTTFRKQIVQNCHSAYPQGKSKFEEDISAFNWTHNTYNFNQKCDVPHVELMDAKLNLQFVPSVWKHTEHYFQNTLNLQLTTPLAVVGNTTVTEVVYQNFFVELEDEGEDDQVAEASVTLWYLGETTAKMPSMAEVSFKLKSKHEAWSHATIMTMHAYWQELGRVLPEKQWLLGTEGVTKTGWIYQRHPQFCQPTSESNDDEDET